MNADPSEALADTIESNPESVFRERVKKLRANRQQAQEAKLLIRESESPND